MSSLHDPLSAPLAMISIHWTAREPGGSLNLISPLWMSWIMEAPADWGPVMAGINAFDWPKPFSRDPSKIIPYGPQPQGFGLRPPMFSMSLAHPIPHLAIELDALTPIPREWSESWHQGLWDRLNEASERIELFLAPAGPPPLALGLREYSGATHFQNCAEADAIRWRSLRERSLMDEALPSGRAAEPRPTL